MSDAQELAQINEINKGLTSLNATIDKTASEYLKLVKSIEDGNKNIKDNALSFENLTKAQKQTAENSRQLDSLARQLEASEKKLKETEDGRLKTIIENKLATQQATKAISDKVKAEQAEEGSLVRMRQKLSELTKEYDRAGVRTKEAADEINNLSKQIGKAEEATNRGQRSVGQYGKIWDNVKSLLPILGFAGLVAGIKSLITNIVDVRKEFEKYEAVLTNTLGSNKKARQEMQMLQQFAAETPFALSELTGAFVKLTNYGLKPNKDELKKYGDLASSVGKGFDQLTEAVADSVTGQFERLKEFGIKASKEGDKITFTFKEQSVVVDNNATSIKNYILSLGSLAGVSGSMAAISATLGGRISNLGDAWDNLMNSMGAKSSGIMVSVINWAINVVDMFALATKSIKQIKEEVRDKSITDGMNNALVEIDVMTKSLVKNGVSQSEASKRAILLYNQSVDETILGTMVKLSTATTEEKKQLDKRIYFLNEEKKAVKDHFEGLNKIKTTKEPNAKELAKEEKEKLDKRLEVIDIANKHELSLINQRHIDGKTTEEQYKDELIEQEKNFLKQKQSLYESGTKEYEDTLLQLQGINIKTADEANKRDLDLQKKSTEMMTDSIKEQEDEENKHFDHALQENEKFLKNKEDQGKKYAEKQKELSRDLEEAKEEFLKEGVETIFNINESANNDKLEQLSIEKDALLSNDKLTKEQRVKIDEEYTKKANEIKRKQKIANKLEAAIEIGIKTAKTIFELKATAAILLSNPITAALAPMALSQIPWVLGMAGLSLASIAKYKEGTLNSKSQFIAGEAGRELIFLRSGDVGLVEQPTFFNGSKFQGAKIFSNPETEKLMKFNHKGNQMTDDRLINEMKSVGNELRSVKKAILNKPVNIVDKENRVIGQKRSRSQEIYLNRLLRNE